MKWSQELCKVVLFLGLFGSLEAQYNDDDNEIRNDGDSRDPCGGKECVRVSDIDDLCPAVTRDFVDKDKAPVTCRTDEDEHGYCCIAEESPSTVQVRLRLGEDITTEKPKKPKRVSELMCEKYAQYPCVQPKATPLISGGTAARQDEYPFMVQIGFGTRKKFYKYECGGSLISDRWVLGAAHCSYVYNLKDNKYSMRNATVARMGDVQPYNKTDGIDPIVVKIEEVILHPDFKHPRKYNDIALYRLASDWQDGVRVTPFQFAEMKHVRPICLYTQMDVPSYPIPEAIGFGALQEGTVQSKILQKVSLNLCSRRICDDQYQRNKEFLPNGISDESMFCAGEEGRIEDTCSGDSGSSLSLPIDNKCLSRIIGVTSFGPSACGRGKPGVYTRVSHYVDWIEKHVWPEERAQWDQAHRDSPK